MVDGSKASTATQQELDHDIIPMDATACALAEWVDHLGTDTTETQPNLRYTGAQDAPTRQTTHTTHTHIHTYTHTQRPRESSVCDGPPRLRHDVCEPACPTLAAKIRRRQVCVSIVE